MKLEIRTQISINSKPEDVWSHLVNFSDYSSWNPFIKNILVPSNTPGSNITVELEDMKFQPTLITFIPQKQISWQGKLLFKGIFDGLHTFSLIANKDGSTTFVHSEDFNGILVGLFKKKLLTQTKQGFEKMNLALKTKVENKDNH